VKLENNENYRIAFSLFMSVFFSITALPRYAAEVAGIYRCDSYVADNTKLSLVDVGTPRSWEFTPALST
jgi:hypothetical protein